MKSSEDIQKIREDGWRLGQLIKHLQVTKKQFAEEIGVCESSLSAVTKGKRKIPPHWHEAIQSKYGRVEVNHDGDVIFEEFNLNQTIFSSMSKIQLETYTLRVRTLEKDEESTRKRFKKKVYYPLDSFNGENSLLFVVTEFLDQLKQLNVDSIQKRTLQTGQGYGIIHAEPANGSYAGIIQSGYFGSASELVDTATGETVYHKNKNIADTMPLYFMLYIPPGSTTGAMVLQRDGNIGISSQIKRKLKDFFSSSFRDYYLEIEELMPTNVMKAILLNGDIKELIIRNNEVPKEIEDYVRTRNFTIKEAALHLKVSVDKLFKKELIDWIDTKGSAFISLPGLDDIGFKDHNISVKISKDSKSAPVEVDLSETIRMRPYFNIDSEVEKDLETNYPVFESINRLALRLVFDIFADIKKLKNAEQD